MLEDPRFGGFATVDVLVEGDLSALGIMKRLDAWQETLAPDDFAFVYFSGHGTRQVDDRNRSRVFLAAADTRRDDPLQTALPLASIQEFLETLPAGRRALVIDACFTGDGKVDSADADRAAKAVIDEELPFSERHREKEAQLFATTFGRPALEQEELEHGVYTAHLIAALTERFDEADLNDDLVVSVAEAHDHARDRTLDGTREVQIPMAFYKVVGREVLILSGDPNSRRRVESALVSAYDGPQQGLAFFVDGEEKGAFPRTVLVDPGPHVIEFRTKKGAVVDRGRFTFKKEGRYSVSTMRDHLNGGRHLLGIGYAHTWLPGAAFQSDEVPWAAGFRLSYGLRFPSRVPFVRRLGLVIDAVVGFFPSFDSSLPGVEASPITTLFDVGIGPVLRLDLPYVLLSLQPRFGLVNLFREEAVQPYLNWTFGSIGGNFAFGVRPTNRLSIQLVYTPSLYDVPLQNPKAVDADQNNNDDVDRAVELSHRAALVVEIGF